MEKLSNEEIIMRVYSHIEKHKNKTQAPFSISGMARLLVLAEIGLTTIRQRASTINTKCTGNCFTNNYCNCEGDN